MRGFIDQLNTSDTRTHAGDCRQQICKHAMLVLVANAHRSHNSAFPCHSDIPFNDTALSEELWSSIRSGSVTVRIES
jgi:hypothetical protein